MIQLDKLLEKLEIDTESEEWKIGKTKTKLAMMVVEILKELKNSNAEVYGYYKDLKFEDLEDMDIHELVDILFDVFMNL